MGGGLVLVLPGAGDPVEYRGYSSDPFTGNPTGRGQAQGPRIRSQPPLVPTQGVTRSGANVEPGVETRGGRADGRGPCACPPWDGDPVEYRGYLLGSFTGNPTGRGQAQGPRIRSQPPLV